MYFIFLFIVWAVVTALKPSRTTYRPVYKQPISKPVQQSPVKPASYKPTVSTAPAPKTQPKPVQNLKWFKCPWGSKLAPSPAEQKIINELCMYDIVWEREVSFPGLQLVSGGWARFDFLLVDYNIIIEYDGEKWHQDPARVEIDKMKSEFCSANGIRLIRWKKQDYCLLPQRIEQLMSSLNVEQILV